LPLAGWGLWRAVRLGRREWVAGRPPVGWVLLLYAAADLAGTALIPAEGGAARLLPLAVLGVLLAVFCAGDLVRGVAGRMVLGPPQEEEAAAG
jgi:hypothetical protein